MLSPLQTENSKKTRAAEGTGEREGQKRRYAAARREGYVEGTIHTVADVFKIKILKFVVVVERCK